MREWGNELDLKGEPEEYALICIGKVRLRKDKRGNYYIVVPRRFTRLLDRWPKVVEVCIAKG